MIEAGHPVPDAAGLAGAVETLALADTAGPDDLVLVLMSGGASANWIAPAAGLSLAEKQAVTRALLGLRRLDRRDQYRAQASLPHQGRTAGRARAAGPARHDRDLRRAGRRSGGDRLGPDRAGPDHARRRARDRGALSARRLRDAVDRALADPANETPKPGDPVFADTSFVLAMRPARVFAEVEAAVRAAGYECILLGTALEGEARAGRRPSMRGWRASSRRKAAAPCILSGGELTVTLRGKGRGGPNQEYALALAIALDGTARHRGARRRHRRHRRRRRAAR